MEKGIVGSANSSSEAVRILDSAQVGIMAVSAANSRSATSPWRSSEIGSWPSSQEFAVAALFRVLCTTARKVLERPKSGCQPPLCPRVRCHRSFAVITTVEASSLTPRSMLIKGSRCLRASLRRSTLNQAKAKPRWFTVKLKEVR